MNRSLETICDVATTARKHFENHTIPHSLLRDLYLDYQPSFLDIDGFLIFAERIFPRGNCGLASVYLRHLFHEGKVIEGLYGPEDHQFLGLGGLIVDITADQFNGPPVFVGSLKEPWESKSTL